MLWLSWGFDNTNWVMAGGRVGSPSCVLFCLFVVSVAWFLCMFACLLACLVLFLSDALLSRHVLIVTTALYQPWDS